MSETVAQLQRAFILHHRRYRESSVILDVFTQDYGRISLLAKGAKQSKSRSAAMLQTFIPLCLSFAGRGELKTLTHVEIWRPYRPLQGVAIYCGFYLNELVQRFVCQHDPHREIFSAYDRCLQAMMQDDSLEPLLRRFEMQLLRHSGYGLQLDRVAATGVAVVSEKRYGFQADSGVYEDGQGAFGGTTLLALQANQVHAADAAESKRLLRLAIDHHLAGKPLQSRALIRQFTNSSVKSATKH